MRLDLFVPQTWEDPTKKWMHEWYLRSGYVEGETVDYKDVAPDEEHLLACPCAYREYKKFLN